MATKRMQATLKATIHVEFEYDDELELDENDQAAEELAQRIFVSGLKLVETEGVDVIDNPTESDEFC